MDFDFILFHTNFCISHYSLKSIDKLIYIHYLHSFNTRLFINDSLLYSDTAKLFNISVRSVYRSIHNLITYKFIIKQSDKYFLLHDMRFDFD